MHVRRNAAMALIQSQVSEACTMHLLARSSAIYPARIVFAAVTVMVLTVHAASAQPAPVKAPIVITGADRRPATSLDGDWASIVDPYSNGFSGYFRNQK